MTLRSKHIVESYVYVGSLWTVSDLKTYSICACVALFFDTILVRSKISKRERKQAFKVVFH